jgi:hypothetical protein
VANGFVHAHPGALDHRQATFDPLPTILEQSQLFFGSRQLHPGFVVSSHQASRVGTTGHQCLVGLNQGRDDRIVLTELKGSFGLGGPTRHVLFDGAFTAFGHLLPPEIDARLDSLHLSGGVLKLG